MIASDIPSKIKYIL